MIRRVVKAVVGLAGLGALAWLALFVPLGERTLAEHVRRIAATDEAQDLGREAGHAGRRLGSEVERTWHELTDAGAPPDAGRSSADGRANDAGPARR